MHEVSSLNGEASMKSVTNDSKGSSFVVDMKIEETVQGNELATGLVLLLCTGQESCWRKCFTPLVTLLLPKKVVEIHGWVGCSSLIKINFYS